MRVIDAKVLTGIMLSMLLGWMLNGYVFFLTLNDLNDVFNGWQM